MLDRAFAFLSEAGRLASVGRASVLMDLSRAENSAEHSWHVALWAMVMGASDRAIAMILIHDLVEIDVGDQPIHLDHDAPALALAEAQAARRIFGLAPQGTALAALWRAFEDRADPDAVVAKRMDHIQPIFQALQATAPLADHLDIVRDNLDRGRAARFALEWPEGWQAARTLLSGRPLPDDDLARRLAFLAQADGLKGMSCRRAGDMNRATRSWHLALAALVICGDLAAGDHAGRIVRMLLVHDLDRAHVAGPAIFDGLPADDRHRLAGLWAEFAQGRTPAAVHARLLMDRLRQDI